MKLKVFDVDMGEISDNDAWSVVDPIKQAGDLLGFTIEKIEEIYISKDEITVGFKGNEWSPTGSGISQDMAFWFAIKYKEFDNGGSVWVAAEEEPEVYWDDVKEFYEKHAGFIGQFVTAIDKGDFPTMKKLNKEFPDSCKPSISNSFYARWLVKIGSLEVMEWAKSVDSDIDFSPNSRHENPLKIAIGYNHEDIAIWLIDNYPVSLTEKWEKDALIKKADEYGMTKLVARMQEETEFIQMLVDEGKTKYVPQAVKDMFLF